MPSKAQIERENWSDMRAVDILQSIKRMSERGGSLADAPAKRKAIIASLIRLEQSETEAENARNY